MSVIDIYTDSENDGVLTGQIKMPMRRVSGAEEWRVRAWIELTTLRAEWLANAASGIDFDAIHDGATDDEIAADITDRLLTVPGTDDVGPITVTRDNDTDSISISITATHNGVTSTMQVGA